MFDQLSNLKKLTQMDEEQLVEEGLKRAEGGMLYGLEKVREDVIMKRQHDWENRDEIREWLQEIDAETRRKQWETVIHAVESDIARIFVAYHEMVLEKEGVGNFFDAIGTFAVSLHNPVVQESLLIPVHEDYRDDYREQLHRLGQIMWGWAEATAGIDQGNAEFYIRQAAKRWDVDPDQLYQGLFTDDE